MLARSVCASDRPLGSGLQIALDRVSQVSSAMEQGNMEESVRGDEYLIGETELRSLMSCYVESPESSDDHLRELAGLMGLNSMDSRKIKAEMQRVVRDMDLADVQMRVSVITSYDAFSPGAQLEVNPGHLRIREPAVNMQPPRSCMPCHSPVETALLHRSFRPKLEQIIEQHVDHLIDLDGAQRMHALFNEESNISDHGFDKVLQLFDVADRKAEGDLERADFVQNAKLQPPKVMRIIDIDATCLGGSVVLQKWPLSEVDQSSYTAISHTWGLDVYEVFDCACASVCLSMDVPRCCAKPCTHQDSNPETADATNRHKEVVQDILYMCSILQKAGVRYAWHDGVCIAQHNKREVQETIESMGWIYSSAMETIVFLDYVGKPVAPISNAVMQPTCRWHTRVWTVQETALSRSRRYCVRVGNTPLGDCQSLEELESVLALWYNDDSSEVQVIQEARFFQMLKEILLVLLPLLYKLGEMDMPKYNWKMMAWAVGTSSLWSELRATAIDFPTQLADVLNICCSRQSKHAGDRINSILTLAGVKDFVAEKDVGLEDSTIEFFNRQEQKGLATALFSINSLSSMPNAEVQSHTQQKGFVFMSNGAFLMPNAESSKHGLSSVPSAHQVRKHTWVPPMWEENAVEFVIVDWEDLNMRLKVLEDGNLEVTGIDQRLVCVRLNFILKRGDQRSQSRDEHRESIIASRTGGPLEVDMTQIPSDERQYACSLRHAPEVSIGSADMQTTRSRLSRPVLADGVQVREGDSFEAYLVLTEEKLWQASPESIHEPSTSEGACPLLTVVQADGLVAEVQLSLLQDSDLSLCSLLSTVHPDGPDESVGEDQLSLMQGPDFSCCPLLLVQGPLPVVSKIGHFWPTESFYHILRSLMVYDFPSLTILEKLVVR